MARAVQRRRRVAFGLLACLALGAFAFGATFGASLGDGAGPPQPDVAGTLPAQQLAGERIVVGLRGTAISPALRQAIGQGRVAGVVLFAANFPSRAAGRRLIAQLQGIQRPPELRDPLLVMVDQEGGLVKRVGGAPTASAGEMGARGAAFSARQGRRHRRQPARSRRQRRLRPGARRRAAGRGHRRNRTQLRRHRGAGRSDCNPVRQGPSGRRRGGDRQALPGLRRGERKHRLLGRTDRPLEGRAAGGRREALQRPSPPPGASW